MKYLSILAIFLGLTILMFPEIIAYLIGVFLIVIGINGLVFSGRINRVWRLK